VASANKDCVRRMEMHAVKKQNITMVKEMMEFIVEMNSKEP